MSNLSSQLIQANLKMENFPFYHNNGQQMAVFDPGINGERSGQFFISLPGTIAPVLPGTVLEPSEFLKLLRLDPQIAFQCIDDHVSSEGVFLDYRSDDTGMDSILQRIVVFHGSLNPHALAISHLAAAGTADLSNRASYQEHIYPLIAPVLQYSFGRNYHLRIVEDCIASGDTLMGVIAALERFMQVDLRSRTIRIDALVATTQSLLLLKEYAEQNLLNLDIAVGYLAYGLSKGTVLEDTGVHLHANYIIYPNAEATWFPQEKITALKQINQGPDLYVVGDMGDAAKSLPNSYDQSHPWNAFRLDSYGNRTNDQIPGTPPPVQDELATILYFANGGYLFKAYLHLVRSDLQVNECTFSAKRVWSSDQRYGYGVLLNEVPGSDWLSKLDERDMILTHI